MANEIVKLGTSPDGSGFDEKALSAASVIAESGASVETHMTAAGIHVTGEEKLKLNSMALNAQANVIESIKCNGLELDVSGKAVDIAVPTKTSELTNDSGYLTAASTLSATKISGVIPVASIPAAAVERLSVVANDTARFALTSAAVQNGDTVKVTGTGKMYYVKDDTKLASADGYEEYSVGSAASVAWGGITSKPTTLSGYGITDAPTANLIAATQAEAEAGSSTTVRAWTPQRVMQAANKAASSAAANAIMGAPKDIVCVASTSEIASSGVRAGGIVMLRV